MLAYITVLALALTATAVSIPDVTQEQIAKVMQCYVANGGFGGASRLATLTLKDVILTDSVLVGCALESLGCIIDGKFNDENCKKLGLEKFDGEIKSKIEKCLSKITNHTPATTGKCVKEALGVTLLK